MPEGLKKMLVKTQLKNLFGPSDFQILDTIVKNSKKGETMSFSKPKDFTTNGS